MFSIKLTKMHISLSLYLFTLISISFIKAIPNTIEIKDVNFTYEDQNASFNISKPKLNNQNITETKTISIKINQFREVFQNKLSSENFTVFPQMRQTDNNTEYEEQKIKCNKINLQSDNFLSYNLTNSAKPVNLSAKAAALEIQYFLFQEPGWIDDNTNYVRPGNLMIEIKIHNYSFCEDIAASYNYAIESNNSAVEGFDINQFPNCKGFWSKEETSGKLSLIENKSLNVSDPTWKNKSYFEIEFELNTNDDTNFVYDDPTRALELKTNSSYLRVYQAILLDDRDANMEPNYPNVIWNSERKRIVMQIPKFKSKARAWIFVDMNYTQPPTNFKGFSTIAFFVILAFAVLFAIYMLIKRKKMKEQLIMEEKLQNLRNV